MFTLLMNDARELIRSLKLMRKGHKKETNGRSNKLYRGEMRPSSVIHDANLTQLDFVRPSRFDGCFMVFRARVWKVCSPIRRRKANALVPAPHRTIVRTVCKLWLVSDTDVIGAECGIQCDLGHKFFFFFFFKAFKEESRCFMGNLRLFRVEKNS